MTIASHRQLLELGAEVMLMKLDLTPIGVNSIWYFCNDFGVTFDGQAYDQVPFEISEIEKNVTGEMVAPKISLPNTTKFASALVVDYRDAVGAELTRTKTFQRFLDTMEVLLGPELITNGDFTSGGSTPWVATNGSTLSVIAGASNKLRVTNNTAFGAATQSIATVVGRTYRLSVQFIGGTASGGAYVKVGTTSAGGQILETGGTGGTPVGTTAYTFVATTTTTYITVQGNTATAGQYADFDNITVRELNPASGGSMVVVPNPTADPTAILSLDVFTLEQKVALNKVFAQWELRALADTGDRKVPGRTCLKELCPYAYRTWDGAQFVYAKRLPCPYNHATIFRTINNEVTTDPAQDACDHRVDGGCKARETGWPSGILGFGGFPGMSRFRVS